MRSASRCYRTGPPVRKGLQAALVLVIVTVLAFAARQAMSQDSLIAHPVWVERPDGESFAHAYPQAAMRQNVMGHATLDCVVRQGGLLDCNVADEEPAGWGFGEAALQAAQGFRIGDRTQDGQATLSRHVRLPMSFRLDFPVPPVAEAPPEVRAFLLAEGQRRAIWEAAPNYDAVLAAYPAEARRRGVRGRAVLSCRIKLDRTLNCEGARETPTGYGFLAAALRLAPSFRLAPRPPQALLLREPLLLPINFGASRFETPVGQFYNGMAPLELEPPAPIVVAALYPTAALRDRVEGQATVLCTFASETEAPACALERESPAGAGFGAATLAWTQRLPLRVADLGLIPGDQARMTVDFKLPAESH
jgi:hypothetical protein